MKKLLLLSSIIVVILLTIFLYTLKPDEDLNHQASVDDKLVIWAYSPALIEIAKEYEKNHDNIEIVTKLVENPQTLLEELYVADSAGNPPQIAEVPSFYGIAPLIQSNSIVSVEDYLPLNSQETMVDSIVNRFKYKDELWAIPLSYQIPLLYVNDNILSQNQIDSTSMDLDELLEVSSNIQKKNKDVWGLHSDTLYPWYIQNLLKNNGFKGTTQLTKSDWGKARIEYDLIHPYTYHLAITQFVNSKGAILLSTSNNLLLFEKLIGSKFKWSTLQLPIDQRNIITNGDGLVIFNHPPASQKVVQTFLDYMTDDQNLKSFAIKETVIPAFKNLIKDSDFFEQYRQFPGYQQAITNSLAAEGQPLTPDDENTWKSLKGIDKNLIENR